MLPDFSQVMRGYVRERNTAKVNVSISINTTDEWLIAKIIDF